MENKECAVSATCSENTDARYERLEKQIAEIRGEIQQLKETFESLEKMNKVFKSFLHSSPVFEREA